MLTEEAHHMFVGQTGVGRILQKTAEVTRDGTDPLQAGVIPIDMIQRYVNLWYSLSLDLFGGEDSSNAALFFGAGLKGRDREQKFNEHSALDQGYTLNRFHQGQLETEEIPLRRAMNEVLRDAFIKDCEKVVSSWNRTLKKVGGDERITLPNRRFNRHQGIYAGLFFDLNGEYMDEQSWNEAKMAWLPSAEDRTYVKSLMTRSYTKPGEYAPWIAPPPRGINNQPLDFEYVQFME